MLGSIFRWGKVGDGGGRWGMVREGGGWWGKIGEDEGWWGKMGVQSQRPDTDHDTKTPSRLAKHLSQILQC